MTEYMRSLLKAGDELVESMFSCDNGDDQCPCAGCHFGRIAIAAWIRAKTVGCDDEGCPHYGTQHGHAARSKGGNE